MTRLIRDPEIATLVHAESGQRISTHAKLLCRYSPFFSSALGGPFQESTSKIVEIHDTEEWVLETFHHWLYFSELCWIADHPEKQEKEKLAEQEDKEDPDGLWTQYNLVKLCCFADQYNVPKFFKDALRELCERLNKGTGVDADAILFAQDHLVETSPIVYMLAEAYIHFGLRPDDEKDGEEVMRKLKPAFAALVLEKIFEDRKIFKQQHNGVGPGLRIDIDTFLAGIDTVRDNKNRAGDQAMENNADDQATEGA